MLWFINGSSLVSNNVVVSLFFTLSLIRLSSTSLFGVWLGDGVNHTDTECHFQGNSNSLTKKKKFTHDEQCAFVYDLLEIEIIFFRFYFLFFFNRFDTNKSTKGASKLRRDLINTEIANLRDLLPLPQSTRQRLSQLQLMALVCVYVRKANYFQQGTFYLHESIDKCVDAKTESHSVR